MLRWSNGSLVERSPRRVKNELKYESNNELEHNVDNQAHQNSMLEYDWTMQQQQEPFSSSNKREDTYNKMAEREPICQIGQNPFMPNSSFADVVNNLQQNIPLVKEKREE